MLIAILILAVGFVAFTNGANANFKGVASLYGSGTASKKTALYWGTALTFAGSLVAMFLSEELLKKFGGRDIVPNSLARTYDFAASVALAAATTSFLATRLGFPVSTTHALVGALLGAGLAGNAGVVNYAALGKNFLLPLFVSPLVAAVLGCVTYGLLRIARLLPEKRSLVLDVLHFLSTGAASFARGLNDTPKMVALLLIAPDDSFYVAFLGVAGFVSPHFNVYVAFLGVATMIALGALLDADKVAETLGKKVTDMNAGQGFSASLVTAGLVIAASMREMPVSTTHVSVGSLLGIGAVTCQAKWKMVGEIFLAWFSTVPCGAVLGAICYAIISRLT